MEKKRTKPLTITPAQIGMIRAAQQEGKTRQQAANIAGVSVSTVARYWKPTGSGRPKGSGHRDAVMTYLEDGYTLEAITAKLNISEATVRRYRRELFGARPYTRKEK